MLPFDTHTIFGDIAWDISIVVAQVDQYVINTALIYFPAAIRVHFAAWHFVILEEPVRQERGVRVDGRHACLHSPRLVVVDAEQIDLAGGQQFAVAALYHGHLIVLAQDIDQLLGINPLHRRIEEGAVEEQVGNERGLQVCRV
ncbi:hypothetical protein D3C86_1773310 [compost metagenome]